jgi:uncharacterized protein YecE (DUF72 family)
MRIIECALRCAESSKQLLNTTCVQFAPWISTAPRDKAHVKLCADRMASYLTAFEFRNASWFDERHRESTLAFERERGLVHVVMDAPEGVPNRAHTVWEATSPELVIVRMHGRNAESWSGSTTAAGRFNYDYPERELELEQHCAELARRAQRLDRLEKAPPHLVDDVGRHVAVIEVFLVVLRQMRLHVGGKELALRLVPGEEPERLDVKCSGVRSAHCALFVALGIA